PNQLKKVVIPAAAVAGVVLLLGVLFMLGESGSAGSAGPAGPGKPRVAAAPAGDTSREGMTDTLPPKDAPEFRDAGDGLKVWDVKVGDGPECPKGATVTIHYTGWTLDGHVFDSTAKTGRPYTSPLANLIRGWQEGVPGMKPGGIRRLYIPA